MRTGCWELGKMHRRRQSSESRTFPLVLCARLLVSRQCEVAGSCASGGFRGVCRLSRQSQGRTDCGFGRDDSRTGLWVPRIFKKMLETLNIDGVRDRIGKVRTMLLARCLLGVEKALGHS